LICENNNDNRLEKLSSQIYYYKEMTIALLKKKILPLAEIAELTKLPLAEVEALQKAI